MVSDWLLYISPQARLHGTCRADTSRLRGLSRPPWVRTYLHTVLPGSNHTGSSVRMSTVTQRSRSIILPSRPGQRTPRDRNYLQTFVVGDRWEICSPVMGYVNWWRRDVRHSRKTSLAPTARQRSRTSVLGALVRLYAALTLCRGCPQGQCAGSKGAVKRGVHRSRRTSAGRSETPHVLAQTSTRPRHTRN